MIVEQYPADVTDTVHRLGDIILRTNIPFIISESGEEVVFSLDGVRDDLAILLEVPLGDAVAYWHPYGHWGRTTLPPDWRGLEQTSLARSAPLGCLYGHDGSTLLGFALDDTETRARVRFGASEETKGFVVCIDLLANDAPGDLRLKIATGLPATETLGELSGWQRDGRVDLMPVSSVATEPVYSTWYAYHHDVDAETLLADAPVAAELGFGSLFLDFGWQRHGAGRQFEGCGDWVPDTAKFADMPGFVARVKEAGLAVIAWVAPFLLGERSDRFADRVHLAPHHDLTLNTHILDPRHREVREDVVRQLAELVSENDLDGLKIDFVDTVAIYDGTPSPGDIAEVPVAVRTVFRELRAALTRLGKGDVLIEFRQPYTAAGMMEFANVMRAEDCPGDSVLNRTSILDARLSGWGVVHSDMMMWHPDVTAVQLVRHLHSSMLGVPQLSMPVRELAPEHADAIRRWLTLWRRLSSTTLDGTPSCSLHDHAPVATLIDDDGLRAVVVVSEPGRAASVPYADEVVVVNATAASSMHLRFDDRFDATAVNVHGETTELGVQAQTHGDLRTVEVPESGHLVLRRIP
jgi:alpha-galactosidase